MEVCLQELVNLFESSDVNVGLHLPRRDVYRHGIVTATVKHIGSDHSLCHQLTLVHTQHLQQQCLYQ